MPVPFGPAERLPQPVHACAHPVEHKSLREWYRRGGILNIPGRKEDPMDDRQLKKFLAGLCLTGLLTGAGLTPANAQQSGQSG